MAMIWSFQAVDTFFFRDGTPFNADESSLGPISQFPPSIETIQGAVRTQLARLMGWKEGDAWPEELGGADSLRRLSFVGPFLSLPNNILFPFPAAVLKRKDGSFARLAPSKEALLCDLGEVRLPALPTDDGGDNRGASNVDDAWVTENGLTKFLSGGVPDREDVVYASDLWHNEPRVGIEINPDSRTVRTGRLSASTHVRPEPAVSIRVQVDGIELNDIPSPMMHRLGGESRQARTEVTRGFLPLPPPPALHERDGLLYFTVTLVTPGRFGDDTEAAVKGRLTGVPGALQTACVGKITQQGGWDMANRRPRALQPIVPAGSTWFYTAPVSEKARVLALHGKHLSQRPEFGYGQVVIGTWRDYH